MGRCGKERRGQREERHTSVDDRIVERVNGQERSIIQLLLCNACTLLNRPEWTERRPEDWHYSPRDIVQELVRARPLIILLCALERKLALARRTAQFRRHNLVHIPQYEPSLPFHPLQLGYAIAHKLPVPPRRRFIRARGPRGSFKRLGAGVIVPKEKLDEVSSHGAAVDVSREPMVLQFDRHAWEIPRATERDAGG